MFMLVPCAPVSLTPKARTPRMRAPGAMPSRRWCEPIAPAMPVPCGCGVWSVEGSASKVPVMTPARSGCWPSISESITATFTFLPVAMPCASTSPSLATMYCAESPWILPAGAAAALHELEGIARLQRNPRADLVLDTRDHGAHVQAAGDPEAEDRAAEQVEPLRADDLEPELALQRLDLVLRKDEAELHHHFVAGEARLVDRRHAARQRAEARRRHDVDRRPAGVAGALSAAALLARRSAGRAGRAGRALLGIDDLVLLLLGERVVRELRRDVEQRRDLREIGCNVRLRWCRRRSIRIEQHAAAELAAVVAGSLGRSRQSGGRIVLADLRPDRAASAAARRPGAARSDEIAPIVCDSVGELECPVGADETADNAVRPRRYIAGRCDGSINPKFTPTSPPAILCTPEPLTVEDEVES